MIGFHTQQSKSSAAEPWTELPHELLPTASASASKLRGTKSVGAMEPANPRTSSLGAGGLEIEAGGGLQLMLLAQGALHCIIQGQVLELHGVLLSPSDSVSLRSTHGATVACGPGQGKA